MSDDRDIPLLVDVVDLAEPPAPARNPVAGKDPGNALDALAIEAAFMIDELVDEYLPQIEARLRERLEARLRELVAYTARENLPR